MPEELEDRLRALEAQMSAGTARAEERDRRNEAEHARMDGRLAGVECAQTGLTTEFRVFKAQVAVYSTVIGTLCGIAAGVLTALITSYLTRGLP